MATKRQIKKLLKSKKLSGRETAALIIENQVALELGNEPTLTREEIEALKMSLIDRTHEGIEYNALLDTYQLAGYIIREASIEALEAIQLLEAIRGLANQNLADQHIEALSQRFPEVLTQEEYDQRYAERLEQEFNAHTELEEVLFHETWEQLPENLQEEAGEADIPPDEYIYEEHPQYFKQALEKIINLIEQGSLTIKQLPAEKLSELQRLRSELEQDRELHPEQAYEEEDPYYKAWSEYKEKILQEPMLDTNREEVLKMLAYLAQDEVDYDQLWDHLESLYCQNRELIELWDYWRRISHSIAEDLASSYYTVIVKEGKLSQETSRESRADLLKEVAEGLKESPLGLKKLIQSVEEQGESFMEIMAIMIARTMGHLRSFYASKIALDELSALLQVDIAPLLKHYEERVLSKIETYNQLAQNDADIEQMELPRRRLYPHAISKYTPLPMINLDELKPSEEYIQRYRNNLDQYLGKNWIQDALSILRDEWREDLEKELVRAEGKSHA